MQTLNRNLAAMLIGASALVLAVPAQAQVDASIGGNGGVNADTGASIGGGDGVSADADVTIGDTSADADVNLGTDGGATASVNANVGDAVDGSIDLNAGDTELGIELDLLAEQAASASGSGDGLPQVVASMSSGQIARYKPTCSQIAGNAEYPTELRELCKLIMMR